MPDPDPPEEPLAGGVANAGAVVRVGDHVLRPSTSATPAIHDYLRTVRRAGFLGVPEPIGIDADGRERLVFVEGDVALPPYPAWAQSDAALVSTAELLSALHRAGRSFDARGRGWSTEMADPAGGTQLCHNDVCLENVVFRDGRAVALLDFDFCAPGRPVYDLAQFARMCVPIDDDLDAARLGWESPDRLTRLRLVADAVGLDPGGRRELVGALDDSMRRGGEFVRRRVEAGDANFVAMWEAMGGQERFDRRRRWWDAERPAVIDALG